MSTVTQSTPRGDGSTTLTTPARVRTRQRFALGVVVIVIVWSVVELINLSFNHTIGPEIYGVMAAVLALGAGIASGALLWSARPHPFLTIAVVVLWVVVGLAGIAGTVAHAVGPDPHYGPVDPRPRPPAAPLIFTLFGLAGGGALLLGRPRGLRRALQPGKE